MDQLTRIRGLHAHVLLRRRAADQPFLLSDKEFRFIADCERMRVDRNGSVLSLLLITVPETHADQPGSDFLVKHLEGRLRGTDTPGWLADGRIAVLLPDTSAEGAWKVASDLSEVFAPGPSRPQCEVRVYSSSGRQQGFDRLSREEPLSGVSNDRRSSHPRQDDVFFARQTPRWKRATDLLVSAVGLALSAPVVGVAAVGIRLSTPGPVFFTQEREGLAGRRFKIWKLRTMYVDADERKQELLAHSHQDGAAFKMRRDPRTTKIGRFLRWSSVDELPQLWNVFKGDMSLVGPRPLPTAESAACHGWQRRRLNVVPGLTCTWQVTGRGKVAFDDWVRMDLDYIKRQSIWMDAKLILLTLPSILFHRGMR